MKRLSKKKRLIYMLIAASILQLNTLNIGIEAETHP